MNLVKIQKIENVFMAEMSCPSVTDFPHHNEKVRERFISSIWYSKKIDNNQKKTEKNFLVGFW